MSDAETARILGLSEDRLRVVLLALASTAEGQNQIKEILNDLDEPSQATKKATTSARRKRKAAEPTDTEPTEANEEEAVALLPGRGRNRGRNRGPNKETNTSKRRRTDGNAEPETAQQANEDSDTPATTDAASGRTETTASLSEKVDRRRLEMLSLPSKPSLTVPSTGGRRARRIPRVRNRGEYLSRCERCSEMYDINSRSLSQWDCWSHPGKLLHLSESPVFRNFPAGMGPFDTAYYRRAFPEGFEYSCCKRAANSPGCTLGRHSSSDAGGRL